MAEKGFPLPKRFHRSFKTASQLTTFREEIGDADDEDEAPGPAYSSSNYLEPARIYLHSHYRKLKTFAGLGANVFTLTHSRRSVRTHGLFFGI